MGGRFTVHQTGFGGVFVVDTNAFSDSRGVFARWFCDRELKNEIAGQKIVNVNFSKTTKKGTIRGMHFQYPPDTECKIVRCIRGRIYDVIVDIRVNSPTFLQYFSVELSSEKMNMLVIPKGFAHGFQSLEDDCEIMYLVTQYYSPENESGLNAFDPKLGIIWPLEVTEMSNKDRERDLIDDSFCGIAVM